MVSGSRLGASGELDDVEDDDSVTASLGWLNGIAAWDGGVVVAGGVGSDS